MKVIGYTKDEEGVKEYFDCNQTGNIMFCGMLVEVIKGTTAVSVNTNFFIGIIETKEGPTYYGDRLDAVTAAKEARDYRKAHPDEFKEIIMTQAEALLEIIKAHTEPKPHVVLTAHKGYTSYRTSHTPNHMGSDPIGVEEQTQRMKDRYPGCTIEVLEESE